MTYQNQVIWITGASSGVGEGLAKAFAEQNAKLIISARRIEELERVKSEIGGTDCFVLPQDVTDYANLPEKISTAMNRYGHLDMMVCNAGITQNSRVEETSLDTYRKIMEVDFFAVVKQVQEILPIFVQQRSDHFVLTSSVAGKYGIPRMSAYVAAKHALHGFADTLRAEVAADDIRVTSLILADVRSQVNAKALTGDGLPVDGDPNEISGVMDAVEAGRIMVEQLGKNVPDIEVIASEIAEDHLRWQARDPTVVYQRMAELAERWK